MGGDVVQVSKVGFNHEFGHVNALVWQTLITKGKIESMFYGME